MNNKRVCLSCESEITRNNDSKEHVIPNSIGGRKKVRGFICKNCNGTHGESWEAKLAEQLNWFSLAVGIKRERGKNPDEIVRTLNGNEFLLRSNGTITNKYPFYEAIESDGKVNIRMFARTKLEARTMLQGIKKKYPNFDIEQELKNLKLEPFRVKSKLQHCLEFGGAEAGRSVVKTALAQCFDAGISPYRCEIGIHTLRTPNDDKGFALFYIRDVVINRPKSDSFHLVAIRGDSKMKFPLLAYVEYFGVMRMVVNLSNKFEGDSFVSTYAINPQSGENLELSVNWDIPEVEIDAALNGNGVIPQNFDRACKNSIAIASHMQQRRERHYAYREELSAVLSELGVELGGIPTLEDKDQFDRLMTEKLGSFSDFIQNIPSLPEFKK